MLDVSALNRIFSNIISNALKHSDGDLFVDMKENGTITFSNTAQTLIRQAYHHIYPVLNLCKILIHGRAFFFMFQSDGDLFVDMKENGTITFSNTAQTLNSVIVGRLFERFYTVGTNYYSTGLGLSIAKLLTERMGGQISESF